jgi:catalase
MHALTIMYTDRGTPKGYRHMHGYSANTFKWSNENGEVFFVKSILLKLGFVRNY